MLRFFSFLFTLMFAAALIWPYYTLYRLDSALSANHLPTLQKMVDLAAVQAAHKHALSQTLPHHFGAQDNDNPLVGLLRQGLGATGNMAVDYRIDLDWVRVSLYSVEGQHAAPGLLSALSFAFFESPTRFLVRLGNLGEHPVHFYLTLQDWNWRVTAIYTSYP
jgi:hypothetical protein